jgi:hypothetical protein
VAFAGTPYPGGMPVDSERQAAPPDRRTLLWVGLTLLLLFVGLPVCLLLTLPLGVAHTGCGVGAPQLSCSSAMQLAVLWLPVVGLLAGLMVCLVGGLRARKAGRTPLRAVGLGWLVFVVFELAVVLLAQL